jgi:quercetin dioxygenase-like cupin family protein
MPREFGDASSVTLEEVSYPPNGFTRPHRHPCPVVAYVVEGSIRMQVKGGAERVYQAGEAFYEDPTDIHLVSANGSSNAAAKVVASFAAKTRRSRCLWLERRDPEPRSHDVVFAVRRFIVA